MIPLAQLLVSGLSLNYPAPAPPIDSDCRDVRGQIEARVDGIRATVAGLRFRGGGSSTGDWSGPVQLEVLKRFNGNLKISLRIEAGQGVVKAQGTATAPAHPVLPHTREVAGDLQVRGESGSFQAMTGTLAARGTADTRARTLRVDLSGQVCQAAQSQSGPVDGNPRAARYHLERLLSVGF